MRFPKETRAAIHEAAPHPATISWPPGAAAPQAGRLYWVQSAEDLAAEQKRRQESPETCAEVMAAMKPKPKAKTKEEIEHDREALHRRIKAEAESVLREYFNGDRRQLDNARGIARARLGIRSKRRRSLRSPLAGSERIYVIATEVLEHGFEAKVVLYEDPDPIHHMQIKAKVPAGPDPISGEQEPTELEPEQLPPIVSRLEEEEALRMEHKASVDRSAAMKAEQHVANLRRRGKRSKLAEQAVERAKKREAQSSAVGTV